MRLPGFVGGTVRTRSRNVNAERTVNLYSELERAGTPQVSGALYRTPGVRLFSWLAAGPVRGLFAQNPQVFAAGGSGFYLVPQQGGPAVQRGTIAVDSNPVSIIGNGTNGHQVMAVSAGLGYIYDTVADTFTPITDDGFPTPSAMAVFIDGYFLSLKKGSNQFNWCAPLNGLDWDGTDVALTQLTNDAKRAIAVSHRYVFVLGYETTEVWQNTGGSSTFEPNPAIIEHGIDAPYSIVDLDNTLFWLGRDKSGAAVVWKLNGFTPQRVSTHAVEYWLGRASTLEPSIAYGYTEQGHGFYVLYVPGLWTTWVYDVTTNEWHERAIWNLQTLRFEPHYGRCHCYAWGKHLIGDRQSRAIYQQSLDYLWDEAVPGLTV